MHVWLRHSRSWFCLSQREGSSTRHGALRACGRKTPVSDCVHGCTSDWRSSLTWRNGSPSEPIRKVACDSQPHGCLGALQVMQDVDRAQRRSRQCRHVFFFYQGCQDQRPISRMMHSTDFSLQCMPQTWLGRLNGGHKLSKFLASHLTRLCTSLMVQTRGS